MHSGAWLILYMRFAISAAAPLKAAMERSFDVSRPEKAISKKRVRPALSAQPPALPRPRCPLAAAASAQRHAAQTVPLGLTAAAAGTVEAQEGEAQEAQEEAQEEEEEAPPILLLLVVVLLVLVLLGRRGAACLPRPAGAAGRRLRLTPRAAPPASSCRQRWPASIRPHIWRRRCSDRRPLQALRRQPCVDNH